MKCLNCNHQNRDNAIYCKECGAKLELICPNCGNKLDIESKFCDKCGKSLTKQNQKPETPGITTKQHQKDDIEAKTTKISPDHSTREAERRQLTVMFCDLVGSTALSEQLDPEELRDVIRDYQSVCAEVISRYDGHIAKYLGDGLLVYFGYPMAHEDDAQRAVHTGLEIVGDMEKLNACLKEERGISLAMRIGIHTGLVVAGEMGGGDVRESMAIVGETPNIAARLEEIAEPDTVVISPATYRLIQGYFDCVYLGSHQLKGLSQPMEVYKVLHKTGVQSRLDVAITKGLTPLVGREQEVQLLLERWEQAKEGMGQVVLLSGEAGIGKSRLLQVLKEHLEGEVHTRIENRCSPYYQNSSLYPVINRLQRLFEFKREDSPEEKLGKVERIMEQYNFSLEEMVPLFASLLSIPLLDRYPPLNLTPQKQKQITLETLLAWLLKETENKPVLYIIEDLHWVDPSTLEFLTLLVDQVPTAPIFTLFAYRPDFSTPWAMRSHISHITLNRLARKQVERMVKNLSGGKHLPAEVVQHVVTKTDGVPIFVEELTKMVLESEILQERDGCYELTGSLPSLAIPTTLQDSLMARLDRLGTVKDIAQLGATLGREFTHELLQAVSTLDEEILQRDLAKLVDAELLYQRGLPPTARYFFKHALIQEAAYHSLLKSKRQQYHQKIAQVLEKKFPETAETQPELLAHHYTEGNLVEQAIHFWQNAGQRAMERSANVEAIGHLSKGLEVLKSLPDTPESIQQELDLQITLGPALMATKGYPAPEVKQSYARALELCQQLGETPQLFPALLGLSTFYLIHGEFQTAYELGERLYSLAQNVEDSALLVEAHYVLGTTLFHLGELAQARKHLERGITLYDSKQHSFLAFRYGQDPGVFCLCYMARILWFLGYPDSALKRSHEALALSKEISHPFSLALALNFAALIYQLRQEGQATQERADEAITLCTEHGFTFYLTMGTILRGWALTEQGQGKEGIAETCQGLAEYRVTGAELFRPHFLALLAESYGIERQAEEGLTVLTEALAAARKGGKRFYEAELYRLKGEFLLDFSAENQTEAENCFRQAIDIAKQRSARSWELRAVMSLSRLLQKKGKKEEAIQMLDEIYGWFTEGFDTADLKEARTLIEELS